MLPVLNEAQKKELYISIEAEIFRRSFYEFFIAATKILYPQIEWQYPPFIKWLCNIFQNEVERIQKKEEKKFDIILNMPFRSGKSILCSQILPVWCYIRDNSAVIMQISHSELLAVKHSHVSKLLIESEWFKERFKDIRIRHDTSAKANYMLETGGKRISFGITSGIIGEGFNFLQIVDDINNPNDSQAITQNINEVYANTLYSRISDFNATRIILQQRTATNDICGYLLDTNPDKYMHICLPVMLNNNINPPEVIELYEDGLLWKDRFSEKVILDFKQTLGSRNFSQQMMQLAIIEEGNILKRIWFKKIKLFEFQKLTEKQNIEWYAFIDTAYGKKQQEGDASAVVIACKFNNQMFILKVYNLFLEFPMLIKKLKEIQKEFNIKLIYVETKASGLSVIQQLRSDGFNVSTLTAEKDKVARANAIAPILEGGRIYIIEDNWNEMFLSQVAAFPFTHDDMTDAFVYGVDKLLVKVGVTVFR
jgi:predicted phage terminase large subunit-like protein